MNETMPTRAEKKRASNTRAAARRTVPSGSTFAKLYVHSFEVTAEEIKAQEIAQDNRCAICGDPPGKRRLHVDHCHTQREFRGLLCQRCNHGLGHFRDDPALLLNAITYLADPPAKQVLKR